MEKRKVAKVNYLVSGNGIWIENRDCFVDQQFPPGGGFIGSNRMARSGRDLEEDFRKLKNTLEPGKFVESEEIEY